MTAISLVVHAPISVRGVDINSTEKSAGRSNTADSMSLRTAFLSLLARIGGKFLSELSEV